MRTATRSWWTSARSATRRSSRTSTWTGCAPASRSPAEPASASGSHRPGHGRRERLIDEPHRAAADQLRALQRAPLPLRVGRRGASGWIDRIVKADVVERRADVWDETGCFPGEPVFVAAPDAEDEDEGVLLSVVLDGDAGQLVPAGSRRGTLERARAGRGPAPHPVRVPRPVRPSLTHLFGCQKASSPPAGAVTTLRQPAGPSRGSRSTAAPSRRACSVASAISGTST